jgi:very-short-patch-repair endonuclease
MLKTHYRSRHESLISFSNDEFYERKLRIFPSPGTNVKAKGLIFNHNPDTIYERGKSRTNPLEAKQIAQSVLKHAVEHPELTLGVVAFSMAQREAIMLEVECLRREHNELEEFFHKAPQGEGLFIKNLENVQGDERDIIYISIGYGRTDTGKVTQSFGPLNKEGGQRRLNVLVTRARLSMEIFCNFTSEDIKVTAESSWGLKAFRNFLHYAQQGELLSNNETGKEPDSPFEEEVIKVIKDLGYDVEPQVGCSGYYLDLAVRDPLHAGRYILAVECDGASYHCSLTARDRDRMRQGVLEGLGWKFHRIWSTDWFRNRKDQSVRLKEAIEAAIKEQRALEGPNPVKKPEVVKEQFTIERTDRVENNIFTLPNYVETNIQELDLYNDIEIYDETSHNIASALLHIINVESPIHESILTQRLCAFYDLSRAGTKIRSIVKSGLDTLMFKEEIKVVSSFVYKLNKEVVARERSALPASHRKFELIAPEEVEPVFLHVIHESISVNSKAAMLETVKFFGFSKITSTVEERFNTICLNLEKKGKITINKDDEYKIADFENINEIKFKSLHKEVVRSASNNNCSQKTAEFSLLIETLKLIADKKINENKELSDDNIEEGESLELGNLYCLECESDLKIQDYIDDNSDFELDEVECSNCNEINDISECATDMFTDNYSVSILESGLSEYDLGVFVKDDGQLILELKNVPQGFSLENISSVENKEGFEFDLSGARDKITESLLVEDKDVRRIAKAEYPADKEMQEYTYKKQLEAKGFMQKATDAELKAIAVEEYLDDYDMQRHTYKSQESAKEFMQKVTDAELKAIAVEEYPDDYDMQRHTYKEQQIAKV